MNSLTLSKIKLNSIKQIETFFLSPASPRPLGILRIGLSLVLLAQAFLIRGSIFDFFSHDGLVQGELADYLSTPGTPKISWLVHAVAGLGISESFCIQATCLVYVLSLGLLAVGLFTRTASILTWTLHWTLMNTGYTTAYGVDLYAHVFLFYLMWIPAGAAFSLDVLWGRRSSEASTPARLGLRVIQLHLCITYLCSGIEKASGIQWWNGELLWRALMLPVYRQWDMSWLAQWPLLSKLGGWSTLLFELGYCVFIWPKATRKLWVAAIVSLHLGIAIFLGLGLFGLIMCVLTFSVFGIAAEPRPKIYRSTALNSDPLFSPECAT